MERLERNRKQGSARLRLTSGLKTGGKAVQVLSRESQGVPCEWDSGVLYSGLMYWLLGLQLVLKLDRDLRKLLAVSLCDFCMHYKYQRTGQHIEHPNRHVPRAQVV